jgi:hypothetical protein
MVYGNPTCVEYMAVFIDRLFVQGSNAFAFVCEDRYSPTDSVVLTAFIHPNSVPYIELFSSLGGRLDNVTSCVQIQ